MMARYAVKRVNTISASIRDNTTSRIGLLPILFARLSYMCICLAQLFVSLCMSCASVEHCMCASTVGVCVLQPGMVALVCCGMLFVSFVVYWFCLYVESVCLWILNTFPFEIFNVVFLF